MAPIAHYWRGMGYDLSTAFPNLPDRLERRDCVCCDLKFYLPQLIGGADLYAALQRNDFYYGVSKWEFTAVLKHLSTDPSARSLLEFGCGAGHFLKQATPLFEEVQGIDFNEDAVAFCRQNSLNVDVAELSTIDRMYDVIVTFQVLEHLARPGEAFEQLARLVRPGGQLIVAVPNEDGPLGELEHDFLNLPPHHFTRWTRRTLEYLAVSNGLTLEKHVCEQLSESLYVTLVEERFNRNFAPGGVLNRVFYGLARRVAVALALAELDSTRKQLVGHTQIAFYRRPGASGA